METTSIDESIAREPTFSLRRLRLGAFYLAVLATLGVGVAFLGDLLPLLVLGWIDSAVVQELGIHRLHVMSIALFVGTGLLLVATQLYRPRERGGALVGATLIYLVGTAILAAIGSEFAMLGVFLLVPAAIAILLHPAGRRVFAPGASYSPALVGLLAVAVVPLALFVAGQLDLQLTQPLADEHAAQEHYVMMALVGVAIVVVGIVAASGIAGWRVAAWITGLVTAYFGLMAVSFTAQTGTVGTLWGGLAIVWAIAFVAVAEYSRRDGVSTLVRRPFATGATVEK